MDFEEAYRRGIEARPRRTLLGTAFRALLAGLLISGLAIVLAVLFDNQRLPPDEPSPVPGTRTPRTTAAPRSAVNGSSGKLAANGVEAESSSTASGAAAGNSPGQRPPGQRPASDVPTDRATGTATGSPTGVAADSVNVPRSPADDGSPDVGTPLNGSANNGSALLKSPNAGSPNAGSPNIGALQGKASRGSAAKPSTPTVAQATAGPAAAVAPLIDAAMLERLEESIVTIEAGDEGKREGVGAGFVIDARGWIATNYHVLADATAARARFKNGATYEIAGYAAIEPELDLAIVSLKEPPRELAPLSLADEGDPRRLAPVLAIGHPRGVEFSLFDGKVSRVLATSELPRGSQRFVRQLISGSADHRWIQHTAKLSEGNSGGPLVDSAGAVVGINTWVDRQAAFSYSLHVRHLRELRDAVAGPVEPLRDYARKEARVNDLLARLTPALIEEWLARAESMRWSPESASDYEVLQQLAWAVTVVKLPDTLAGGRLEERLDPLLRAARKVEQRLAALRWDAAGQVTLINELALGQVARPMAGVFLFGVVERTVEGDAGERGALVKLAGADQMLFLPLDGQLVVPAPGLQCLVLGVNYDGHRVRYGDNPLKLITAHVIASRTLLPLEKPSE
ncbi:MAG: Periplasmic serine endoprotease DegP precursor [Planctomycetota bacterium]